MSSVRDWEEEFEKKIIHELENNPEETLSEIEKWVQKHSNKLKSLQEDIESNIDNSTNIPVSFLIDSNELYFQDETDYSYAATMINFSVLFYFSTKGNEKEKLEQLKNITGLSFDKSTFIKKKQLQSIAETGGVYDPSKKRIRINQFPESFYGSIPVLIRPLIEQTVEFDSDNEESMTGLEETILHEGTHAFIDENVANGDREVYHAVNEAAARTVSHVYSDGSESPATGYRKGFDVSIMQTAEKYFHDLKDDSSSVNEFISKVRGEVVRIERKAIANPEKDILSLINAEDQQAELQKIKSFVYLLERVQYKVTDFLSGYGLIGLSTQDRQIIKEMNEYVENDLLSSVENAFFEERSIFERKIDSELLGENVGTGNNGPKNSYEELFGGNTGQNILNQFAEARKELIKIIEHLEQEINEMENENLDRKGDLTLKTLKNDREELKRLVEEMGSMLRKVTADGEFEEYINEAENSAYQRLTNQKIKEILNDSNRTSSQRLRESEQSLETTLIETANAWEAVLKRHQEINKSVINFCKKFHEEIEAEEEKIKKEDHKYQLKVEAQGINNVINRRKKDFEIEITELENLANITEKLYEFAKVSQSEVGESLNVIKEAKRKAKEN